MRVPIEQFAQVGISHHLLFPDAMADPARHEETLPRALALDGFEVVDLFVPAGDEARCGREIELILGSGKTVVYNCPLLITGGLSPSSPDAAVRERTLAEACAHLPAIHALGARKAVVASGVDPGEGEREAGRAAFVEFMCALCERLGEEVHAVIEPFDRSIGKNLLVGPSAEAADVVRRVRATGHPNVGISLDMGHLPLMGESFADALAACGDLVEHVHLGNCVQRNPDSAYYGDMHPPLGIEDGEHDEQELAGFLGALLEAGYLPGAPQKQRPTLTMEARPYPGLGEEQSARVLRDKMKRAWEQV